MRQTNEVHFTGIHELEAMMQCVLSCAFSVGVITCSRRAGGCTELDGGDFLRGHQPGHPRDHRRAAGNSARGLLYLGTGACVVCRLASVEACLIWRLAWSGGLLIAETCLV